MNELLAFLLGIAIAVVVFCTGSITRVYDYYWCREHKVECVITQPEIAFGYKEYHNWVEP